MSAAQGPERLVTGLEAPEAAALPALRASEERYRSILRAVPDVIAITSLDARILLVSPRAVAMYRAAGEEEILGRPITDFLAAEERERAAANIGLMFQGILPGPEEYCGLRLDGSRFPLEANAEFIRDAQGQPSSLVFVVRDITGRKGAEEELRVSEARQRALLQAIPDLIFSTRRNGEFLAVHACDPALLFMPPERFLRRTVAEVLPGPFAGQFMAASGAALDTRAVQELAYALPVAGEERHFEARVAPSGEDTVITVVRDVTARVRAERSQRTLEVQLLQAQKLESLGSLAGGVAHDMNNVLGAILGLASAHLEAQPPDSAARQAFGTIIKAAERGGRMVKSLLSFARQTAANASRLDLNELLHDQVRLLEGSTLAQVRVVLDLAGDLRPILGDASALAHAFMNLCVNAADAMPGRGTLTLSTRNRPGGWVEVAVADTGTGMTPEVQARALDPFFTTKELGKGTGLGLSMVYGAVQAHRGQLELQSEPGRGTRVTLRFPACEPGQAGEPVAPRPGPAAQVALEVLLVDDDALVQTSTRMLLEALGHTVVGVTSGEAALERLEAGLEPGLVILDLNMPGLGGGGTLPRLRALRPELPVLLATGRADQTALDLVAADRGTLLLAKPFTMGEMRERIGDVTGRG